MTDDTELLWVKKWPTEPGAYWFYGYRSREDEEPKLYLVKMFVSGDKVNCYVTQGLFLRKSEGARGLWAKAELPEKPDVLFDRIFPEK